MTAPAAEDDPFATASEPTDDPFANSSGLAVDPFADASGMDEDPFAQERCPLDPWQSVVPFPSLFVVCVCV